MSHLTPDQFVDLAEGVRGETSAPHLASCEVCRRQLADMRAMMSAAASVDAPEPSPLFWDHLSSRVREAVAEDAARPRSWRERLLQPRVLGPALAAALAAALVAVLLPRAPITTPLPSPPSPIALNSTSLLDAADDPQLGIVAAVATTIDWDERRREMALAPSGSSSAALIDALTIDEQRELQRLLAEEMERPSALENLS